MFLIGSSSTYPQIGVLAISCGFPIRNLWIIAIYSSPKHFVVCHVLLRLLVLRHPPCALINLTFIFCLSDLNSLNIYSVSVYFLVTIWYRYSIFNVQSYHLTVLMEPSGIEPLTSCVQSRRSPSWAKAHKTSQTKQDQRTGFLFRKRDPAAPSDTATLLRLHLNHLSHLRRLAPMVTSPTSGVTNSWCDGRCKGPGTYSRGVLIRDISDSDFM